MLMCHWCFSASVFETQDGKLLINFYLVNFLQIGEGQTYFILNQGRVTVFLARKKYYLRLSKNLYIKKLSSPY